MVAVLAASAAHAHKAGASASLDPRAASVRKTTAATFAPERTVPVQKGAFKVNLVIVTFPDCLRPASVDAVLEDLEHLDGGTIEEYYKDYSQGLTWPVLVAYPKMYEAPHPLGYYCRHDASSNPLGFKEDGVKRVEKLRADALAYVAKQSGPGVGKGAYTCWVYCCRERDDSPETLEKWIRPHYPRKPSPQELLEGAKDPIEKYKPEIPWADPLWPCSVPQVHYPGGGRTVVHELGHCLGSPDFYHASEEHDGLPGSPSLPWAYGPTGPAYCRVIYHAFVPPAAYPKISAPAEVTLAPRTALYPKEKGADAFPLGVFVPSSHPNYIFCIEYCHDERLPAGIPGAEGLLVNVINTTMTSPSYGPPDLCYTYRAGDPDHKAVGETGAAYLQPGDSFDAKSDPAAILPNLMPAGIEITDIRCANGVCTFKLGFPPVEATRRDLDFSLLPQTEVVGLSDPFPTSFRASMNVRYRGEPLLFEYGFCYGLSKDPTEKTGTLFPLHHRDRYDARLLDLKPGVMYYVRAYARNANGIRYSANQKGIVLPDAASAKPGVALFGESDRLLHAWHYKRRHFGTGADGIVNSANPLLAFMALANYYRALPGGKAAGRQPVEPEYVHCDPSDKRPKFRMAETEKLHAWTAALIGQAGFSQPDFAPPPRDRRDGRDGRKKDRDAANRLAKGGKGRSPLAAWASNCAAALKIRKPVEAFAPASTPERLLEKKDKIREWLMKSQPVLLVRQSRPMEDDLSERWPLDVAIIDGLGTEEGVFHVVHPGGSDRGRPNSAEGFETAEDLLHRTTAAILLFYRPDAPAAGRTRRSSAGGAPIRTSSGR